MRALVIAISEIFFNDSIINKNLQFWVDKSFLMKYPIYYYIIT